MILAILLALAGPGVLAEQSVSHAASTAAEAGATLSERIDEYLAPLVDAGHLSGTLLVARNGRVVYERAFGMANHELGVANTVATKHGIASVTKLLTGILTLKLADEGALDLGDSLDTFVPGFPRGGEITVRHLLRHRSGIPHRVTGDGDVTTPRSAADMAELASAVELLFDPGSERAYSSAGYSVLARVLEVATGQRYASLLNAEIFGPAGVLHAASADGWSLVENRSDDYKLGPRGAVPARPADLSFLVGAGSVFATPRDLYRVLMTLENGGYGERARAEFLGEDGTLSWNGQTFGYRTFVDYGTPEESLTVIFAGNLHAGAIDLVRRDVPRITAGEDVAPATLPEGEAVMLSAEERTALSGVYQFRAGDPDSESALRFAPDGSYATLGWWVLVPISDDRLLSTTDYGTLEVLREDDGSVRGLEWSRGDASFALPRVRSLNPRTPPGRHP